MWRAWVVSFFMVISSQAIASDEYVADWRLDKPFLHGFIQGLSLQTLGRGDWQPAQAHSQLRYTPVHVAHLEKHRVLPYALGQVSALAIYGYIGYLFYRRRKALNTIRETS